MIFHHAMKYLIISTLAANLPAEAQTFSSGSTGTDGALSFTTPGTYTFDPKTYTPVLDPANDGVFNFTTITIASGVTVKLIGTVLNTPVVWLAQGAVKIDGTIDLSGQDGINASTTAQRTNTIPGSGGYAGGYPGVAGGTGGVGLGPAGGVINGGCGGGGGFASNQFLVPLVGGSGGAGGNSGSGGAGAGAILIASNISISGAGSVRANGGAGNGNGGGGAGGAIRLVSSMVTLSGNLIAKGGASGGCGGAGDNGIVRVEGFQIGTLSVTGAGLYTASPFGLFLSQSGIPAVSVVSVGSAAVPPSPTGTFTMPDVSVNSSTALPVAIQAANVPIGTVVTLVVFSENGPDQTILSSPLAGTLASSTATASVTLPPGFSKGFVKATF